MNKSIENSESLGPNELLFLVQQIRVGLGQVLLETVQQDKILPEQYGIIETETEDFEHIFPASTEYIRTQNKLLTYFNVVQFNLLMDKISSSYYIAYEDSVVEEDTARLYLGSGLALYILESLVLPKEVEKVNQFYSLMSSVDRMHASIAASKDFNDEEKIDMSTVIMKADESIVSKINLHRFIVGMVFEGELMRGNDEYPIRLRKAFIEALKFKFAGKKIFLRTATELFQKSEEEAYGMFINKVSDLGADEEAQRMFSDQVSELELAAVFPMDKAEITEILNICIAPVMSTDLSELDINVRPSGLRDLPPGFGEMRE
jgi:hypothetical protein